MKTRNILILAAIIIAVGVLAGCKITVGLNGSSLNYNVYKTIQIGNFPIRAALVYPPLQQIFENKLTDGILQQTRLQLVERNADLEMSGEITGYTLTPQAVGENAYATQTRLTITVHVKYTDNKNSANTVDRSFSAYRDFDSSIMLTDVQEDLCTQISSELVDLIFNATVGNW